MGQPAVNGTSFDMKLISHATCLRIEAAVASFAHSQLEALGVSDEDADRTYVDIQLAASSEAYTFYTLSALGNFHYARNSDHAVSQLFEHP
jgi:hypothetical protein